MSNYMPDDGFEFMVSGPPLAIKAWTWLRDGEPNDDDRWLTGVNWGGGSFFGGVDLGAYFFGSSVVTGAEFIAIEIRFSNTDTQKAYRYLRGGDPNYGFQDFVEVPFTVWDIDSDPPRQLNAAFVENSGSTSEDGTWLPRRYRGGPTPGRARVPLHSEKRTTATNPLPSTRRARAYWATLKPSMFSTPGG